MRVLTKELFEMVLDMTISDITEFLHYESGIVTTEDMTGAGQDQIEKQRRAMEGQEIRKRQVMLGKIASDLLSQARTGMERRIEQLKETAGDGLSREEASDDDVKGASQDETVAASTA
ncbi:hypothetical protein HII31_08068 [Pseudocercospora fuligena]|uniref:Uncharacterized protein n=1 Tax=Pseudocercospora fuligena TaxID=685502 RepID=A0A8H6RH62_9PEZI|nr:hypothetical protein HII31_08068 [Pseudocercospora fuligena]